MYLSWIIPCYNEERRIERTIREVDFYLQSKKFQDGYEILVSNSASRDQTGAIVQHLMQELPRLKLLNIENKGKGWAVKRAMEKAQGDIVLFSDADNSTAPNYFDAMESFFKEGYDVVISSRDHKDAPGAARDREEPWYREILGNGGNLVIQVFGVWGIWDTQNGFKAFRAAAVRAIFSRSRIGGFAFDVEVLMLARRLGLRVGIIPVRWHFDPDSKVTLGAYVRFLLDIFRIRWNVLTGKYHI